MISTQEPARAAFGRDEPRDFRARLRELAERLGSVNALAKASAIPQSTIRKYFERTEPPRTALLSLARAAGVRVEWLMTGEGPAEDPADGRAREGEADVVWIEEYAVGASAGDGSEVGSEEVRGLVAFRRSWVKSHLRCDPDHLCLIHVEGDSMEPTLRSGDMVLVDRADTRPRDGIFALQLDGALYVKRLHPADRRSIEVISDNAERYPKRTVTADHLGQDARIVGRVVWADRRF